MSARRTLVLSIGNTSLFGGVFSAEQLVQSFRLSHAELRSLRRRVRGPIDVAAICSVVPALTPRAIAVVRQAWNVEPHVLVADAAHGLRLGYRRPHELGTDRLATVLGAQAAFPRRNVIVVDCGTATTVTLLRRDGTLLGGAIFPGLTLSAEALAARTAQLPRISPRRPRSAIGRSPGEAIASGVFFGQVGAIRETVARLRSEAFGRGAAIVVATGGHAPLLANQSLFDAHEPHLVLRGLRRFADGAAGES